MARGIIYVMTTVVPGLVKIGKTGTDNYEQRMYHLERNGYSNVTGLSRRFAIEVEDHDDKEKMLHEIFSKSRVPNTELFALDVDIVVQLLSSFDGHKVFPEVKSKEEVFDEAVKERRIKSDCGFIPDGRYFLRRKIKGFGLAEGRAIVKDGIITVLKGSICAPHKGRFIPEIVKNARIENNILMEDIICHSPSGAGWVVIGRSNNGWTEWRDSSGKVMADYRE